MDEDWFSRQLASFEPSPLDAAFSPIAEVIAWEVSGLRQPGSGFLIHPRVVITAAHVVVFDGGAGPELAQCVNVKLGDRSAWARAVTLRQGYFGQSSGAHDLAMLLLDEPACARHQTCVLARALDQTLLRVCGFLHGLFSQVMVNVQAVGDFLEYPSDDLPGCSGGPVIVDTRDGQPVVAGLHRYHDHAANLGRALSLLFLDLTQPFTALGLPPENE